MSRHVFIMLRHVQTPYKNLRATCRDMLPLCRSMKSLYKTRVFMTCRSMPKPCRGMTLKIKKNKTPNLLPSSHFKHYSLHSKTLTFPQSQTLLTLPNYHQNLPQFLQILSKKHILVNILLKFVLFGKVFLKLWRFEQM